MLTAGKHQAVINVPMSVDAVTPYTIGVSDFFASDGVGDFELSSFCNEACP